MFLSIAHWGLKTVEGLKTNPFAYLLIVAGVYIGSQKIEIARLERDTAKLQLQVKQVGLAKDSIEAVLDTTRTILVQNKVAYEKRVLQLVQQKDSLDKVLKRTTLAKYQLEIEVQRLQVQVASTQVVTTDSNDVRKAHFDVDRPVASASIDVALPRAGLGTLNMDLQAKPFSINARIQCGEPDKLSGIRPATILILPDTGYAVKIGGVQQDPRVCQDQPTKVEQKHFGWGLTGGVGPSFGPKAGQWISVFAGVGFSWIP